MMKMKTLITANEQNSIKKSIQKPNILRKKSTIKPQLLKTNVIGAKEPVNSLPWKDGLKDVSKRKLESQPKQLLCKVSYTPKHESAKKYINQDVSRSEQSQAQQLEIESSSIVCLSDTNIEFNNIGHNGINIDSFLNGADKHNTTFTLSNEQVKEDWCLDLISSNKGIVLNTLDNGSQLNCAGTNADLMGTVVTTAFVMDQQQIQTAESTTSSIVSIAQSPESFTSQAIKFKCDIQNCNKGFWSAAKLMKHKNTHNKQTRWSAHISVECPVKKVREDGIERCGQMFASRESLLKHLNEDHQPEDAPYSCEVCGRRFFWSVGLRAHAGSRCGRGALVCAWAGCGREFRQPCRLREHLRAHTGDRPYHCTHPNCGWSFRSASKLERHVRGHTGERKHACVRCGRAFLRRDHLRDHAVRCHPHALCCVHAHCKETFSDASSLCLHLKEVHGQDAVIARAETTKQTAVATKPRQSAFVVSLIPETENNEPSAAVETLTSETVAAEVETELEAEAEAEAEVEVETAPEEESEEWHAARTHCTWPLPRHAAYVLEEDARTEQSENSESNIYTVRSDLFLHGNVLINEDSEFIVSRELSSRAADEAGSGMDLIDAHPTIDLLQEELMYADAVDESSFRVFLMNGEDLS
uniref:C2H2-type domain-containing protein n=1 Tax=Bombyx mori TaxID=7091 RepID=A0A8R2QV55_BOMMO|nr:putative zinc finger protein 735 isoform X1 [Bombyx mori]